MNIESWIGVGTLAMVIGSAIVALAMKIATLRANLDAEVEVRKRLEDALLQERGDRIKRDSDLFDEQEKHDRRIQRIEQRRIEYRGRPPHETPEEDQ